MIEADPCIDYRDDDAGATRGDVPRAVRVDRAGLLPREVPLTQRARVVRNGVRIDLAVRDGELDFAVRVEASERLHRRFAHERHDLHRAHVAADLAHAV
jgi:hypothetical protein